jgi:hypothetical protein
MRPQVGIGNELDNLGSGGSHERYFYSLSVLRNANESLCHHALVGKLSS